MVSRTAPSWRSLFTTLIVALAATLTAPAAHALRVVSYNLLNYPGSTGPARDPLYRTVLAPLGADVVVTQETQSQAGVNEFLTSVLNTLEPGEWAAAPFVDGNDTDTGLFYKPAKVQFLGQWAFYPNPSYLLRLVHVYRVKPVGYSSADAELRIYALHLKASTGYESDRYNECVGLRDSMNAMPAGTRALVAGDFNFYKASTEPGYWKLQEDQANNIGRVYDMLPAGDWHDNAAFAAYHTQSTCDGTGCASGAATGGMDDRFDMILPTVSLGTGQGLAVIPGTCMAVGQDGLRLNGAITDPPTIPEGAAYASALLGTSDHLPLRLDLQLPAVISTAPTLAFGSVIVGAVASEDLPVDNVAPAPADSLNCDFAAPAGFVAPDPLAVPAGASAPATVTMSTATAGARSGDLAVASDDPDHPTTLVSLSGTVLDHAQPSLDSLTVLVEATLDFGDHAAGGFEPLLAAVHNRGYDALQARLSVGGAQITGGAGRFSIQGFTPTLVAGTGARWSVAFDDAGATTDSTYEAILVFQSADEPLPGATAQPDVQYLLRARLTGGAVAVQPPTLPTATRLHAPMPNPLVSGTTLRFDLARTMSARLEVFDPSGRRVAVLADREFTPGRYSLRWDGRDESGAATGPGLYFVRLTAPGLAPQIARLAILR